MLRVTLCRCETAVNSRQSNTRARFRVGTVALGRGILFSGVIDNYEEYCLQPTSDGTSWLLSRPVARRGYKGRVHLKARSGTTMASEPPSFQAS